MPYKPKEVEGKLRDKFGFSPAKGHSLDHHWFELQLSGLPPILTKVSHSRREIGPKLEGMIARQLRVRTPYFRGMVDCTNSRADYYRQVREAPYPPFDVLFRYR